MFGLIFCIFIICVATSVCVLGWKYLDECGEDLSHTRYREVSQRLYNIEKLLESKNGGKRE